MIWKSFSMTIPSDTTVRAIHNDAEDAVVSVQEIDAKILVQGAHCGSSSH